MIGVKPFLSFIQAVCHRLKWWVSKSYDSVTSKMSLFGCAKHILHLPLLYVPASWFCSTCREIMFTVFPPCECKCTQNSHVRGYLHLQSGLRPSWQQIYTKHGVVSTVIEKTVVLLLRCPRQSIQLQAGQQRPEATNKYGDEIIAYEILALGINHLAKTTQCVEQLFIKECIK